MSQEIEWLLKEKYRGEKSDAFFADCRKLVLGEPLGYLIGHVPFLNTTIWLDSKPLIPRPETEFWVEKAIKEIQAMVGVGLSGDATMPGRVWLGQARSSGVESDYCHRAPTKVLDLCAGSGCIGVAVAKTVPEATVDFSEIDVAHLKTIEKNILQNSIDSTQTQIRHTNLFEAFSGTYDFILSNPPYIDATLNRTDESVIKNEPYIALFGGKDGMDVIATIIAQAPTHLERGGQLWLEHEPEQSEAIRNLAREHAFLCTTHHDQYGVERYSVLVLQ